MPSTDASEPANHHGYRLGPGPYRVLRAAHIMVSGGWLGVGIGKLILEVDALTAASPRSGEALFTAARAIGWVFPPMIVATLLTGAALSLGTRWGLLRHYWVLTKLGLTLTIVVMTLCLIDKLTWQALPTHPGGADPTAQAIDNPVGMLNTLITLITLSAVYTTMLLATTVISVCKPWGRISWHRRYTSRTGRSSA